MTKTSLTDMLNGNEIDITLSQEGLDTILHLNKEKGVRTISAHGLTLTYDSGRFEENPAEYVAEQLSLHQDYYRLMKKELSDSYGDLHEMIDKERDLQRILQFVPENATGLFIGIAKLAIAPTAWIRFKTLKGKFKGIIQNEQQGANGYRFIEAVINYGKDFIEERLAQANGELPEATKADLTKWVKVQGDLSYFYSRLVSTADKKVQASERMYKLLFPNSEI